MSTKLYEETSVAAIADAIRAKKGESSSTRYTVGQMAAGVASIPTGITPTGSLSITQNGTYDVTDKAEAVVNVSGGGGFSTQFTNCSYLFQGDRYTNASIRETLLSGCSLTPTNCNYMFGGGFGYGRPEDISSWLSNVDMSQVTTARYMFQNFGASITAANRYILDLSNFRLNNCSSISGMFSGCRGAHTIKIGSANMSWARVTDTSYLFYSCTTLNKVVIGGTDVLKASATTTFQSLNSTCKFYVPDALVNSYKTATNWSSRAAYIFPLSEYVES